MLDLIRSIFQANHVQCFTGRIKNQCQRACRFESLESRTLLAIDWVNRGTLGNDSDDFEEFYGATNAAIARTIVDEAILDWEAVITNSNLSLEIFAGSLPGRGRTENVTFVNGLPTSADITLDDNGQGNGWYFDLTPQDDAEFTALANSGFNGTGPAFHASFVDVDGGHADFYRTIVHEIGHAVGLISNSPVFSVNSPLMTFIGPDPREFGANLYSFHNSSGPYGVTATITTSGGRHLYEVNHPNDLMNPGRITPVGQQDETLRQFISDFDVQLLADAYGYSVTLPSSIDTAHAVLDSQTGTLLVQGRAGGLADTITISTVGSSIQVAVNSTTEVIPSSQVSQIVVARNGGSDSVTVTGVSYVEAHYVVSSNQDSADAGTLGDGLIDHDGGVPGSQVSLRAAVRDANGGNGGSIYVPRGKYRLTLEGTGGDAQGDLDISKSITIIGSGPGEAIIDASGLGTTNPNLRDRIFEVSGSITLSLYTITLTGGRSTSQVGSHGGAILVRNGANVVIGHSTLVGNEAVGANSNGGAIYFETTATGTIINSVISANHAGNTTGGVFLQGSSPNGAVTLTKTIVANNTAVAATGMDVRAGTGRSFTSGGNNRITTSGPGFTATTGDYIPNPGITPYVVTGWGDSFDSTDDASVLSVREAVHATNQVSGQQEIWLPAWNFKLTRQSIRSFGATDVDTAIGDLDIHESLTIRGVAGSTSVAWRTGTVNDAVFDLIGDFNGDGIISDDNSVDNVDFVIWRDTLGSTWDLRADADDNGIIENADKSWWQAKFGNVLTRIDVA
jgi:hypothetical protein